MMRQSYEGFPSYKDIELPLLNEIARQGGQAKPSELYKPLADFFQLTQEDLAVKRSSQRDTRWKNDVQFVRGVLVKKGELLPTDLSGHGVYKISSRGEDRLKRHNPAPIETTWQLGEDFMPLQVQQAEMANIAVSKGWQIQCMVATSDITSTNRAVWKPGIFVEYNSEYGTIVTKLDHSSEMLSRTLSDQAVRVPRSTYIHLNLEALEKEEDEHFTKVARTHIIPEAVKPLLRMAERTRNILLYGPPGTGKTWLVTQFAKAFTEADKVEMVTFHQSFAYEEFVEGIRPRNDETGQIFYRMEPGAFRRICHAAQANPTKKYLLIIDEINRANIAKVLGELITLIEDDKRLGEANEVQMTLPYSGDKFGVPANLTILGTMNTADRSIALLDLALRRRFTFVEMPPDPTLLPTDVAGVNLQSLLTRLNRRVAALLDPDHRIGHSYLMGIETEDDLHFAWYHRVVPLLQEYFYHDGERMQAVIGKDFVRESILDAETKEALGGAYEDTARYEVVTLAGEAFLAALQKSAA